jgi:ATP-dependent Clp protease ATP-binding subunit ClpC
MEESRNLNHRNVGTGHLLLGVLPDGEGFPAQVLSNLNVKLEKMREEVLNLLGHDTESEGGVEH